MIKKLSFLFILFCLGTLSVIAQDKQAEMADVLREKLAAACSARGIELLLAEPSLCTDNAAMIAYVASLRISEGQGSALTEDIDPNLRLEAMRQ